MFLVRVEHEFAGRFDVGPSTVFVSAKRVRPGICRMCSYMARLQHIRAWKLTRVGATPNPTALIQRARTFAAVMAEPASLVTVRDEGGLSHYVGVADVDGAEEGPVHLAQAVAGRADDVASMPVLSTPVVGYSVARSASQAVRDSQVGVDPAELVRRLAVGMRPGTWVGVSCRTPKRSERRRVRRWYEHRLGTQLPVHHSSDEHPALHDANERGAGANPAGRPSPRGVGLASLSPVDHVLADPCPAVSSSELNYWARKIGVPLHIRRHAVLVTQPQDLRDLAHINEIVDVDVPTHTIKSIGVDKGAQQRYSLYL